MHVPAEWSSWPQRWKLAVPGDHDPSGCFTHLAGWHTDVPVSITASDLLMLGVKSPDGWSEFEEFLKTGLSEHVRGVVVLSHHRPGVWRSAELGKMFTEHCGTRPVVWLHGHEHPWNAEDPEWEEDASFAPARVWRSKVISSARRRRGTAALLEWKDGSFHWQALRHEGPLG